MAVERTSSVGRKVAVVGALALVFLVAIPVARFLTSDRRSEFCTLAASGGGTLRSSPQAAFDDWWTARFPDGPSQADADIDRDGTVWRVHEGEEPGRWRKVEVDHPPELLPSDHPAHRLDPAGLGLDGWVVVGDNGCGA